MIKVVATQTNVWIDFYDLVGGVVCHEKPSGRMMFDLDKAYFLGRHDDVHSTLSDLMDSVVAHSDLDVLQNLNQIRVTLPTP